MMISTKSAAMIRGRCAMLAVVAGLLTGATLVFPAQAQTYSVLYRFTGGSTDGAFPNPLIRDSDGNLYGTTQQGGPGVYLGSVFKLDNAGKETVLYFFSAAPDGFGPLAGLVRDQAGNLYGTTYEGGIVSPPCPPGGCGTVFKLDPEGNETLLHTFTGGADGSSPQQYNKVVMDADGNLYGTAATGGDPGCGCGVIFKIDSSGNYSVLHSFVGTDGFIPGGIVLDAAGVIYGTAKGGGSTFGSDCFGTGAGPGCGSIFKLDTTGQLTVLYSFSGGADGSFPVGSVIQDEVGNLYGVTDSGGMFNFGSVFKVDPAGTETVLYSFTGGADGAGPYATLVQDTAGMFYGTASAGGNPNCRFSFFLGCGVVFELDKAGRETVLYTFTGGSDGANPFSDMVLDASGNLYGTTPIGGVGGGVAFKIAPDFSLSATEMAPSTVSPGASATSTVSVNPLSAFNSSVTLTCSVQPLPALAPQCAISPGSISPGSPAMLTVSTTAPTAGALRFNAGRWFYAVWLPLVGLVTGVCFVSQKRKERIPAVALSYMLFGALAFQVACGGGGSNNNGGGSKGTPAGTYTISVTGTSSGSLQHFTTTSLTVR